jgi:hypothetical protein
MHNRYPKCIVFLILFFFIYALSGQEKEEKKEEEPQTGGAVSIVKFIPGAYQLKSKKFIKGSILFCTFATAVVGAIIENKRGNDLYVQYLASQDVDEIVKLRKQTEEKFKNRNYYLAGTFGIWLLHLLDLKFFNKKKGGIKGEVTKKSINVGFYYSF